MSKFITSILILNCLNLYSQTPHFLEGNFYFSYGSVDNGAYWNIIFHKNGIFESKNDGELGLINYGKGHYTIQNDSLFLNYDLTKLKINGFHKNKIYGNFSDTIQVKVSVFDLPGNSLPRVNVINMDFKYAIAVNKNGIAYLRFKKNSGSKKIDISGLCCGNYSFSINTKYNYEIDVFLREEFNKPLGIKNEIVKYKIIEFKEDYLLLENKDKEIIKWKKKLK